MSNKITKKLLDRLKVLLTEYDVEWHEELVKDLPRKWEKHGDLLMLGFNCFSEDIWSSIPADRLWKEVGSVFSCKRVARRGRVKDSEYRTPSVELLIGEDGWVEHIDNSVRYVYDVTVCMFSAGNISEKLRIASFDCTGETIVDLYAGIGYFTLPYLVHTGASLVYACEWNPGAINALHRGLAANHVSEKCIVLCGDNKEETRIVLITCPRGVADRVNLGLIPSSEAGWPVACAALRPDRGGVLHVHANVTRQFNNDKASQTDCTKSPLNTTHSADGSERRTPGEWLRFSEETCVSLKELLTQAHGGEWSTVVLDIVRIKSYAPHIDHLVVDIKCVSATHC